MTWHLLKLREGRNVFLYVKTCFYIGGFFRGWSWTSFRVTKSLFKNPNDCVNHPKLLFGSFETCLFFEIRFSKTECIYLGVFWKMLQKLTSAAVDCPNTDSTDEIYPLIKRKKEETTNRGKVMQITKAKKVKVKERMKWWMTIKHTIRQSK